MQLARYQARERIFVILREHELGAVPVPLHVSDMQDGNLCVEFARNDTNRIALRLCGLDVPSL